MAFYAAGCEKSSVDWDKFPVKSFECLNKAIHAFRHCPQHIDQVLTAFAIAVAEAFRYAIYDAQPDRTTYCDAYPPDLTTQFMPNWIAACRSMHHIPISIDILLALKDLDVAHLFTQILQSSKLVDRSILIEATARARKTRVRRGTIRQTTTYKDPVPLFEKGSTLLLLEAKDWLLKCAMQTDLDPKSALQRQLWPLVVPQPKVDLSMVSNYSHQRRERLSGGLGLWPDLTRTLTALHPVAGAEWTVADENNIVAAIQIHLITALNISTAKVYQQQRPSYWSAIWDRYLLDCESRHAELLESPFSPYPLHVREVVSRTNYLGNWKLLENMVLPYIIAHLPTPTIHEHESLIMFFTYRWIMLAATHHDADPSGHIKAILATKFNLECLDQVPCLEPYKYCTCHFDTVLPGQTLLFCQMISWYGLDGIFPLDPDTPTYIAKVEAARACIQARTQDPTNDENIDFTNDPCLDLAMDDLSAPDPFSLETLTHSVPDPGPDEECIICKDDFQTIPCVAINTCRHMYHLECFKMWYQKLQEQGERTLTCCYCRNVVIDSKALDSNYRNYGGIVFYWTVAQYEDEMCRLEDEDRLFGVEMMSLAQAVFDYINLGGDDGMIE